MSGIPQALQEHLEQGATTLCHCWRLTRRDETALGFTDHDRILFFEGTHFEPRAGFSQSETQANLGLGADRADIEGALDSERIAAADLEAGLYDGATVETFLVNWKAPEQRMLLRKAMVGTVTVRDGAFVAELESPMRHLDRPNGRHLRRLCDAELGDHRCGVELDTESFSASGVVVAVRTGQSVTVNGLEDFEEGWFANGLATWTSGEAAGRTQRVREHRTGIEGTLLVFEEALAGIQAGQSFDIVAGCDKRFQTCKAKFANGLNFRGFPHLPGNDAAYGYASDGQIFDGGPLVE